MAGMTFTAENLTAVLARIRDCAYEAVAATDAGPPARVELVHGSLVWDDCQCGLLAVTWTAAGASQTFPAMVEVSGDPCGPPMVAVQAGVAMLRCSAVPDDAGNAPTPEELTAEMVTMAADAVAIRQAVACCLRDLRDENALADWSMGVTSPLGSEGACAGSALALTLGFINGGCC